MSIRPRPRLAHSLWQAEPLAAPVRPPSHPARSRSPAGPRSSRLVRSRWRAGPRAPAQAQAQAKGQGCRPAQVRLGVNAVSVLHAEVSPSGIQPQAGRQFRPAYDLVTLGTEHLSRDDPWRSAPLEHLDPLNDPSTSPLSRAAAEAKLKFSSSGAAAPCHKGRLTPTNHGAGVEPKKESWMLSVCPPELAKK